MGKQSPDPGQSPAANYEHRVRESVKKYLTGFHSESFDFVGFRLAMQKQLHSRADLPLDITWLYSAASYHDNVGAKDPCHRINRVMGLFKLMSFLSSTSRCTNCVALLAPVIYEVHQYAVESGVVEKRARSKIQRLMNDILCYISTCSGGYNDLNESSTTLPSYFPELLKIWTMSHSASLESLEAFFPLVSARVWKRLEAKECSVDYLAGIVVTEAFLLMLCLKLKGEGASKKELQKELRTWAVSSITSFHNRHFFEILLNFLLDRKDIATTLMSTEEEKIAREVLYDAVILVDYSFLLSDKEVDLKNILIKKLIVTTEAIKIARAKGDQGKATAFVNAFATSPLAHELLKLVSRELGIVSCKRPHNSSPQSILRWLLQIEQRGHKFFEDEDYQVASELIFDEPAAREAVSPYADDKKMDAAMFTVDRRSSNDSVMGSTNVAFSSYGMAN